MSQDHEERGSRPDTAASIDRGVFDAALRPESTEQVLREGPRRFFALAAEVARSEFDPAERWEEFLQAMWEQVDAGFGLTPDDEEHADVSRAWFDHADGCGGVGPGSGEEPR